MNAVSLMTIVQIELPSGSCTVSEVEGTDVWSDSFTGHFYKIMLWPFISYDAAAGVVIP